LVVRQVRRDFISLCIKNGKKTGKYKKIPECVLDVMGRAIRNIEINFN
jgi:hypothetical protein